jgi:hypothetical protein
MRLAQHLGLALLCAAAAWPSPGGAQEEVTPRREKDALLDAPRAAGDLKLTASLVDGDRNAAKRSAVVQASIEGIDLVDPAAVNEKPKDGQGHLHYQLDGGPLVATTNTKMSFHELTSGTHSITVTLAGNDHAPLGPQQTLTVVIP